MGVHVIKMPDIGEGIAEVELVAWHVRPGAEVAEDQVLADVMTDKATVEIPSPVAGRVLALGGEVGQTLAVGAELIRIEVAGAGNLAAAPPAAAAAVASPFPPPPAMPAAPLPPPAVAIEPAAEPAAAAAPPRSERPIASPAVRRRAWELGIDLAQVSATGTAGRIVQADLDAHVARGGPRLLQAGASGGRLAPREGEEAVRVIGLRRKIAQKMQEAKRRIPHFTYVEEVDVSELEALRARLNGRWGAQRPHLTLLPFLMRAMVLAVERYPDLNARFDDEAGVLTRHRAVHIGIATQTEAGLLVPVLRHAEALDLWASAAEVARLAESARSGRVVRAELSGSTITLTSLGALGGLVATPVINHPEVAIVGVNRIIERPLLRGGVWVPRLLMNLSCSFDHRVIDGLHAAEFVQALRAHLESPATLFMEQGDFL